MAIDNVSDTARWVAYYRAMESDRPDALFHDPFARELAGAQGETIAREVPGTRNVGPNIVVRTAVFDEIIRDRVNQHGADLVLNLAAGLDTRPWRLDLPEALRWIDVDLPGILDYKASVLGAEPAHCHYEAVAVDLTNAAARDALFARVGVSCRRALVISEGLLIYLPSAQVLELAHALHRQKSFRWWLFDLASPPLLRIIERSHGTYLSRAPFQFAPADGTAFFAPAGWREIAFRSAMADARRLHREMPLAWLWRLMLLPAPAAKKEEFRRMSANVLMQRGDDDA